MKYSRSSERGMAIILAAITVLAITGISAAFFTLIMTENRVQTAVNEIISVTEKRPKHAAG